MKRAQSASSAAVVIILIAVMIIFYILFLPPEDRAAILGEESGYGAGGSGAVKSVLMTKSPGRLYPMGNNIQEHTMPSFFVFTKTNADSLKRVDSMYVKNSAFGDNTGELQFYFDKKTMSDPKLSFNVRSHSGILKITLNEQAVFEGELADGSPPAVILQKENLNEKNTLRFYASEPGAAFWRVNSYELQNVLVSAKVTDYSGALSEQHFSISETEYQNLEKATLEFVPDCPPDEEGQLQVLLNGRQAYSSSPDCGSKSSIEISKDYLRQGDNILLASTQGGSFLLDMPKLTTFMKEQNQPAFYFVVPQEAADAVKAGQRGIMLTLRFAGSGETKRGAIEVNGFDIYFETQDAMYQTPLDPESIFDGSNGLKIIPISGALDIAEVRVELI